MRGVLVLNGPNLNLLGTREPDVYGTATLGELDRRVVDWGTRMGLEVATFQSNHEGALIDRIHQAGGEVDGIVINGGAFTHYSYAIHDALVGVGLPSVEVHLSNIHAREPWRATSVTAPASLRTIFGRGPSGYRDALRTLVNLTEAPPDEVRYGDHPEQVIDVRRPDGEGRHPTAVLLHGGFWRHEWARDTIDSLAVDLHRRGWATANVEYRRLGTGGGWPVSCEDVSTAVRTVAEWDGIDPSQIVLVGHSAGGQLALVAARSEPVAAVVALAPLADLARAADLGVGGDSVAEFLGTVAPGSAASPMTAPPDVRQIIAHGSRDEVVPHEVSDRYVMVARQAGTVVDHLTPDVGHFDLLDPGTAVWREVLGLIEG